MFPPSSEAIVWIVGGLAALLALILAVTVVATFFMFLGPPDLHDVPIDEEAPIKDRKTTKK